MTDRNAPFLGGRVGGFTLIELMITMILFAVLISFAVPSFISFRERAVVRGAAEMLIAAVATARMEAVKRDQNVSVNMSKSGSAWCAGVVEVPNADVDGVQACNCFQKDSGAGDYCALGAFPALDNSDASTGEAQAIKGMKGARLLSAPHFGGDGIFTIDPKLGLLVDADWDENEWKFVVRSPSDDYDFQLQFEVGITGKATLCVPSGGRAVAAFRSC